MGKQRDIGSFFSKVAKPAGAATGESKDATKENKRSVEASGAKKAEENGGRLKRLKRAADAAPAAEAAPEEEGLEDAMDEQQPVAEAAAPAAPAAGASKQQQQQQQQQPAAAAEAEKQQPSPAAAAPSPGKVSREEAGAAFGKLFAKGKAAAGAAAVASPGKKGAAKSPAKQQQQPSASPSAASKQQQKSKQQQQDKEGAGAAAAAAEEAAADGAAAAGAKRKPRPAAKAGGGGGGADAEADSDYAAASSDASDDDDEADDEVEEEEEEELEEGAGKPSSSSAAAAKKAAGGAAAKGGGKKKSGKSANASNVDGVGTGALEAAARHAGVDVGALVTWKPGEPVPYAFLTSTFEAIAETTKRLEIVAALTGCFRAILASTPGDLLPAVYLCSNRVGPPHEGLELGVGEAILIRALAEATGRKEAAIKKAYDDAGDLGAVAAASRGAQKLLFAPKRLTLAGVFKAFREIALAGGAKSQERKRALIVKLLVSSVEEEPGYIMRSLQGKLRIGLAEQSLLAALAHAVSLHASGAGGDRTALAERLAHAEALVKQVYSECPSFDRLVPALVSHPLDELPARVAFTPGVPVRPMLAKATNGVHEVLERFGADVEFTCEYKYDGERCQIHVTDGGRTVRLYSRNAEDSTPKFPDVVARLKGWLADGTESVVIDGEAVAWDPVAQRIQPFQVLSTRARTNVALDDIKVQVMVFAFDCLYLNGESLLHAPLTARRAALYSALKPVEGELAFAEAKTSRDVEELATFLNEAVAASTEGLIVKTLGDVYQPSRRSTHWLKLKKDYLDGCGDTFDVVPIGGFLGKGKRSGVYGAYLLAVYDDATETYQTISKLGTGFSEEALVTLADALRPHVLDKPRPYYQFGEGQAPDVWFDAVAVWEVKAADLSISPVHQAAKGVVEAGKGISIRFPRLVRVRDDKGPEDATTAAQVADMYRAQAVVAANNRQDGDGNGDGDDE